MARRGGGTSETLPRHIGWPRPSPPSHWRPPPPVTLRPKCFWVTVSHSGRSLAALHLPATIGGQAEPATHFHGLAASLRARAASPCTRCACAQGARAGAVPPSVPSRAPVAGGADPPKGPAEEPPQKGDPGGVPAAPATSRRRRWCSLCQLPKPPWAVVWDFGEAACRGCVSFEGADRIEASLEAARRFRHGRAEIRHRRVLTLLRSPEGLSRPEETPAERRGQPVPCRRCPAELSEAVRGRAEDWPGKPPAVRERLAALAACAAFNVRFRKDHALVGRVFAFHAAPRPGFELELKLFAEYPCGSGSVYAGVPGAAKQMFRDCPRAPGKTVSSGEKHRGDGDWRLLGELFTEAVRFFRRPPAPEALPRRHPASPEPAEGRPRRQRPPRKASPGEPTGDARHPAAADSGGLACGLRRRRLEGSRFVRCPSAPAHRFCFPCARGAGGAEARCRSGGRCPPAGSSRPRAFLRGEIAAILAGDGRVGRERDP
ncbi:LOW QUALITY PROTEIN: interferon regulatory factor 2-binding protein 1-like [Chlamydotis macqueenii]